MEIHRDPKAKEVIPEPADGPVKQVQPATPDVSDIPELRKQLANCQSKDELRAIVARMTSDEKKQFELDIELATGRLKSQDGPSEQPLDVDRQPVVESVESVLGPVVSLVPEEDRGDCPTTPSIIEYRTVATLPGGAHKIIEQVEDPSSGKTFVRIRGREGKSELLLKEAEMYRDLQGIPGILEIVSEHLDGEDPFLLLEDRGLKPALDEDLLRTLSLKERVTRAGKMLALLENVHERGILHGDLKPEHFMKDKEGNIFLIDFSLAQKENKASEVLAPSMPSMIQGDEKGKKYHRQAILRANADEAEGLPYDRAVEICILGNHLAYAATGRLIQSDSQLSETNSDGTLPEADWNKVKDLLHGFRAIDRKKRKQGLAGMSKIWFDILDKKNEERQHLPVACYESHRPEAHLEFESQAGSLMLSLYNDPTTGEGKRLFGLVSTGKKELSPGNPHWGAVLEAALLFEHIIDGASWTMLSESQREKLESVSTLLLRVKDDKATPDRLRKLLKKIEGWAKNKERYSPRSGVTSGERLLDNLCEGEQTDVSAAYGPIRVGRGRSFFRFENIGKGRWKITNQTPENAEYKGFYKDGHFYKGVTGLQVTLEEKDLYKPMTFGRNTPDASKAAFRSLDYSFSGKAFEVHFGEDELGIKVLSKNHPIDVMVRKSTDDLFQCLFISGQRDLDRRVDLFRKKFELGLAERRKVRPFKNTQERLEAEEEILRGILEMFGGRVILMPEAGRIVHRAEATRIQTRKSFEEEMQMNDTESFLNYLQVKFMNEGQ